MSSIFKRLYNMARVEGAYRLKKFGDMLFGDIEKKARNFESQWSEDSRTHWKSSDGFSGGTSGGASGAGNAKPGYSAGGVPKQVAEDLATFNLRPPCTWEEIKKARNREIKKYHSDRFLNDPEKYKTSKEIMQIYNAAFDRLKAYYKAK